MKNLNYIQLLCILKKTIIYCFIINSLNPNLNILTNADQAKLSNTDIGSQLDSEDNPVVSTRFFTGNTQLDSGLAGLALGLGGALVAGHLVDKIDQKNKNPPPCYYQYRYKRQIPAEREIEKDQVSTRFLPNIFGGSNNHKKIKCDNYKTPYNYDRYNYQQPYRPYHTEYAYVHNHGPIKQNYFQTENPPVFGYQNSGGQHILPYNQATIYGGRRTNPIYRPVIRKTTTTANNKPNSGFRDYVNPSTDNSNTDAVHFLE